MGLVQCIFILLLLAPLILTGAWKSSRDDRREIRDRELRDKRLHYHTKRDMLSAAEFEPKRKTSTPRTRDKRKKPSGHLTPLKEDDMENDEVVSVAIGPPPTRPKYDKIHWKHPQKSSDNVSNLTATNLVKDVLSQLGRELLAREVSEDFVFGQYIGTVMRNLTSDLRLRMQHEVLELVVKYQTLNRGEILKNEDKSVSLLFKDLKLDKKLPLANDTDDVWTDFSNLAKIVG